MPASISRFQSQVQGLLAALSEDAVFTSPQGHAFVTLPSNAFHQTFPIDDPRFRDWLAGRFIQCEGFPPDHAALAQAIHVLRARAIFAPQQNAALRVGSAGAASISIDLANREFEHIEITPHGWSIAQYNPALVFFSTRGQLPLPRPDASESPNVSPATPDLALLSTPAILEWALDALQPAGPYPILILYGPPGSGKSTLARMLRGLLDPVTAPLASLPSRQHGIYNLARFQRVLAFDHVTRTSDSASDALCCVSSGIGIETRDAGDRRDPLMLDIARPIIITTPRNGLHDWIPRPDLASRAVTVRLDRIEHPLPQAELEAAFESCRPALLANLYTALSARLAHPDQRVPLRDPAPVIAALDEASAAADPLLPPLCGFVSAHNGPWTGTATDLLEQFPQFCVTPRALSHRLRRLRSALAALHVVVEQRRVHGGNRQITLRAGPQPRPYSGFILPVATDRPATIDLISP